MPSRKGRLACSAPDEAVDGVCHPEYESTPAEGYPYNTEQVKCNLRMAFTTEESRYQYQRQQTHRHPNTQTNGNDHLDVPPLVLLVFRLNPFDGRFVIASVSIVCDFPATQGDGLLFTLQREAFPFQIGKKVNCRPDEGFCLCTASNILGLVCIAVVVVRQVGHRGNIPSGFSGVFFSCGIMGIFPIIMSANIHGSITTMS